MREKFNHMYLDSHERKLLIHSLIELKNQLIQQGRYTDCVDELLIEVLELRNRLSDMQQEAIYFRGCYDSVGYLKKAGIL